MSTIKFTEDHEWINVADDGQATVGITDYAQEQLGELVYIELPDVGTEVSQSIECAVVESVKAAGDVKSPASGTVTAVNEDLDGEPEKTNEDAMGEGWLFKMTLSDSSELDDLMDSKQYENFLESLA
ncbi:MAG: glycine cleavage system H protein [Parasphingorhabdus sp.]|jgi:glycine cleavage system H protein